MNQVTIQTDYAAFREKQGLPGNDSHKNWFSENPYGSQRCGNVQASSRSASISFELFERAGARRLPPETRAPPTRAPTRAPPGTGTRAAAASGCRRRRRRQLQPPAAAVQPPAPPAPHAQLWRRLKKEEQDHDESRWRDVTNHGGAMTNGGQGGRKEKA